MEEVEERVRQLERGVSELHAALDKIEATLRELDELHSGVLPAP